MFKLLIQNQLNIDPEEYFTYPNTINHFKKYLKKNNWILTEMFNICKRYAIEEYLSDIPQQYILLSKLRNTFVHSMVIIKHTDINSIDIHTTNKSHKINNFTKFAKYNYKYVKNIYDQFHDFITELKNAYEKHISGWVDCQFIKDYKLYDGMISYNSHVVCINKNTNQSNNVKVIGEGEGECEYEGEGEVDKISYETILDIKIGEHKYIDKDLLPMTDKNLENQYILLGNASHRNIYNEYQLLKNFCNITNIKEHIKQHDVKLNIIPKQHSYTDNIEHTYQISYKNAIDFINKHGLYDIKIFINEDDDIIKTFLNTYLCDIYTDILKEDFATINQFICKNAKSINDKSQDILISLKKSFRHDYKYTMDILDKLMRQIDKFIYTRLFDVWNEDYYKALNVLIIKNKTGDNFERVLFENIKYAIKNKSENIEKYIYKMCIYALIANNTFIITDQYQIHCFLKLYDDKYALKICNNENKNYIHNKIYEIFDNVNVWIIYDYINRYNETYVIKYISQFLIIIKKCKLCNEMHTSQIKTPFRPKFEGILE